eukprot:7761366-Pyramimonas_sp.AAC.1
MWRAALAARVSRGVRSPCHLAQGPFFMCPLPGWDIGNGCAEVRGSSVRLARGLRQCYLLRYHERRVR